MSDTMPVAYPSSSELAALTQTRTVPVHCICVGACLTDNDVGRPFFFDCHEGITDVSKVDHWVELVIRELPVSAFQNLNLCTKKLNQTTRKC